jgi:hypothetical protein
MVRKNWRGRDLPNATGPSEPPVPGPKKTQYFPAFSISWPHDWSCITNGEQVIRDRLASPLGVPLLPASVAHSEEFESRRLRARRDSNRRPDRAETNGYARA